MRAIILAAGLGLRLRPLTESRPKGLVEVAGKPLLVRSLEALPDEIDKVTFVVGYLGDQIKAKFGNQFGRFQIDYAVQEKLDGTGGGVLAARDYVQGKTLIMNGDDLYQKSDITELILYDWSFMVVEKNWELKFGVLIDDTGNLKTLGPNKLPQKALYVCGAYVIDERFFDYQLVKILAHEKQESSLPHTLESISQDIPIKVVVGKFWQPVGNHEELAKANELIK